MTNTKQERLEAKHRAAVQALMRAERRMVLAFTRWAKLRAEVRRYDKLADKAWGERIGGEYDVRDMANLGGGSHAKR
jgi:hypothetical protein